MVVISLNLFGSDHDPSAASLTGALSHSGQFGFVFLSYSSLRQPKNHCVALLKVLASLGVIPMEAPEEGDVLGASGTLSDFWISA